MKLLLFISFFLSSQLNSVYEKVFLTDYKDALIFVKKNSNEIKSVCKKFNNDHVFAVSVVFPEIIRYSIFKDFFETTALESVYVKFGKEYADFSIGRFQMKPSFAEKLESALSASDSLSEKYKKIIHYKNKDENGIRLERVQRLKMLSWQLLYLNGFIDVVNSKFPDSNFSNNFEKINFYATAYNYDFSKTKDNINAMIHIKSFPYGGCNNKHQYSYGDISVEYYKKNCNIMYSQNSFLNK
ncbi:MAG: hypothetical protein A2275_11875 [Bacteroidetes bacterium RIFOXYA12_FULL_35_11]|nr:MAG: hypothetical protein A2X01_21035 [Bacteroidetes bacterium GWF2_35_48]OFY81553.1 MAG: hypothetical protein A2275_11875 [Bacteroidetes bacterium RIFOXYA12_FULL_35_11]OFY94405.1 MAG: hypothetical protein A2491_00320 [Bacteroidetes bacterium RIFOXYC12_FULL_35_7]HBX50433.1 hypothetical protein [Bacteroidales bacterium]